MQLLQWMGNDDDWIVFNVNYFIISTVSKIDTKCVSMFYTHIYSIKSWKYQLSFFIFNEHALLTPVIRIISYSLKLSWINFIFVHKNHKFNYCIIAYKLYMRDIIYLSCIIYKLLHKNIMTDVTFSRYKNKIL